MISINSVGPAPMTLNLHQDQIDCDTLAVANEITDQLYRGEFSSAEEARNWLNDPKNEYQLSLIFELNLSYYNLHYLPPELENLPLLQMVSDLIGNS